MKRTLCLTALLGLGLGACSDEELTAPAAGPGARPSFAQVAVGPVVNATDDVVDADGCTDAHCSLREAIALAATATDPNPTITFAPDLSLPATITLDAAKSPLTIQKNLTIQGPGAANLAVSGGGTMRVFSVGADATATLSGLTLRGGNATGTSGYGGAIASAGRLTLSHCVVDGNQAAESGGGIYAMRDSHLTIRDCRISGNVHAKDPWRLFWRDLRVGWDMDVDVIRYRGFFKKKIRPEVYIDDHRTWLINLVLMPNTLLCRVELYEPPPFMPSNFLSIHRKVGIRSPGVQRPPGDPHAGDDLL